MYTSKNEISVKLQGRSFPQWPFTPEPAHFIKGFPAASPGDGSVLGETARAKHWIYMFQYYVPSAVFFRKGGKPLC